MAALKRPTLILGITLSFLLACGRIDGPSEDGQLGEPGSLSTVPAVTDVDLGAAPQDPALAVDRPTKTGFNDDDEPRIEPFLDPLGGVDDDDGEDGGLLDPGDSGALDPVDTTCDNTLTMRIRDGARLRALSNDDGSAGGGGTCSTPPPDGG